MSYTAEDFRQLLQDSYSDSIGEECSKWEFLSMNVFCFSTDDSDVDKVLVEKALEVCVALNRSQTFDYNEANNDPPWYIIMMNMPFFANKTDWGVSIRGAWWSYSVDTKGVNLWYGREPTVSQEVWKLFIDAMVAWYYEGSGQGA